MSVSRGEFAGIAIGDRPYEHQLDAPNTEQGWQLYPDVTPTADTLISIPGYNTQDINPRDIMSHVNELFDCGLDALQKEFLQLLKKHSKPVPVAILNDIAACEDMEGRL